MANRAKSIPTCIGENIRRFRRQTDLTQKELGEKLYKSESAVRMWELGKSEPDGDTLINMAKIFNVTVDDILGTAQKRKPTAEGDGQIDAQFSEALDLMDRLSPAEQQEVLRYMRYLSSSKEQQ